MKARAALILILAPALLAAAGYFAGQSLARKNYAVALADQLVARARSGGEGTGELTNELKAFEASGRAADDVLAEARGIESKYGAGGAAFGAWCGLVAAVMVIGLRRVPRRKEFQIDHGLCVACGRCFSYCPKEHQRLKSRAAPEG